MVTISLTFSAIFYFLLDRFSEAQELRPALFVTNNDGVVRTENGYLGFLDCKENATGDLRETVTKQNSTIIELKMQSENLINKVAQLEKLMFNLYNLTGNKLLMKNTSESSIKTCENSNNDFQNEITNLRDEIRHLQEELKIFRYNKTGRFSPLLNIH